MNIIIISLKCNMFSLWYIWKNVLFLLINNYCLTQQWPVHMSGKELLYILYIVLYIFFYNCWVTSLWQRSEDFVKDTLYSFVHFFTIPKLPPLDNILKALWKIIVQIHLYSLVSIFVDWQTLRCLLTFEFMALLIYKCLLLLFMPIVVL